MRILLTGATGYIAQRLLPVLSESGHDVICCMRDRDMFIQKNPLASNLFVLEVDFLNEESLGIIPDNIKSRDNSRVRQCFI